MLTATPATLPDLVGLAGGKGWLTWRILRQMWMGGESWAIRRPDGTLIAAAGLYPFEPGAAEVWFSFAPGAGRHLRGILRLIRLTLQATSYRRIVCICTSRQGARIAALAGMQPSGTTEFGELWECLTSSTPLPAPRPARRRRKPRSRASAGASRT